MPLRALTCKLSEQRRSKLTLEVRESNVPAQLFFRENGFRATSILHNFYEETTEDAFSMEYRYRHPFKYNPEKRDESNISPSYPNRLLSIINYRDVA